MKRLARTPVICGSLLALAVGVMSAMVMAQAEEGDDPEFAQKFWNYLEEVDYRENWSRWPGHEEGFKESESEAHGALLKIYVNDKVEGNTEDPPPMSIIVKENYNEDEELMAITPMYRISEEREFDPEHNNWFWAKYKPDGTLFEMNGMKMSGKVKGCINCHGGAKGEDYVFANDD